MNQMEIFRSKEFGSIRILEEDGEYLFCGTDVATALGYSNPHKAVRDHTKGERNVHSLPKAEVKPPSFSRREMCTGSLSTASCPPRNGLKSGYSRRCCP